MEKLQLEFLGLLTLVILVLDSYFASPGSSLAGQEAQRFLSFGSASLLLHQPLSTAPGLISAWLGLAISSCRVGLAHGPFLNYPMVAFQLIVVLLLQEDHEPSLRYPRRPNDQQRWLTEQ